MKSMKLTVEARMAILDNVKKAWWEENPLPSINGHMTELYNLACTQHFGAANWQTIKQLWQEGACHKILSGNSTARVSLNGDLVSGEIEEGDEGRRCLPVSGYAIPYEVEKAPKCHQLILEVRKERERLKKQNEVDMKAIKNLLNTVNTTKQLLEVWPESKDFWPTWLSNPSAAKLPAVQIDDALRERLGLT